MKEKSTNPKRSVGGNKFANLILVTNLSNYYNKWCFFVLMRCVSIAFSETQ